MNYFDEKTQVFDFLRAGVRPPRSGRLVNTDDIDAKLMLEKLPQLIHDDFEIHNRLSGNHGLAAYEVLRLLLTGKSISKRNLSQRFGIDASETQFVVDYVVLRVRIVIEKMSDEIKGWRFIEDWRDLLDLYSPLVTD